MSTKGSSGAFNTNDGRLLDKMTIMGRVQEVSARELVVVKAERDLLQVVPLDSGIARLWLPTPPPTQQHPFSANYKSR
jgi:hypothetical protein